MVYFDAPQPLFPELLQLHGKWRAAQEAVVCDDTRLDWQTFSREIIRFATGLQASGVSPRQRIAVIMNNEIETAVALFGIMTAGCVSVPINLSVSNDAMASMLADAEVVAVIASPDQVSRIDSLGLTTPLKLKLTHGSTPSDWQDWDSFMHPGSANKPFEPPCIKPDDELNIIYSSGTTGMPKGIVHTHQGRRDWAYDLSLALRYSGCPRTLLTIGLYSNISWVAMLCTLLNGGTLVIERKFNAAAFIDKVFTEAITHTAMVPVQFQQIVDTLGDGADKLASLQAVMSCGSPLHAGLKAKLIKLLPAAVIELYGLTEGIITTLEPEQAATRLDSVGKPLLGTDIQIIDDDDQIVSNGSAGEIVSRGRITMPGYLNQPEANAAATWKDSSGRPWLRSGDIGRLDEDGYLYIVDRKKDMILSGGQNVYPQDIEAVLHEHPMVQDVAVIAAPSEKWGETPIALVVRNTNDIQAETLMTWCNERVGRQQRLSDLRFIDELPRNPNGKILKRELRSRYGPTG